MKKFYLSKTVIVGALQILSAVLLGAADFVAKKRLLTRRRYSVRERLGDDRIALPHIGRNHPLGVK